jgi:hypothetical protein
MPEQKDRAEVVYEVEDTLPVGSVDKARAGRGTQDEQYPIPGARPVPWEEA